MNPFNNFAKIQMPCPPIFVVCRHRLRLSSWTFSSRPGHRQSCQRRNLVNDFDHFSHSVISPEYFSGFFWRSERPASLAAGLLPMISRTAVVDVRLPSRAGGAPWRRGPLGLNPRVSRPLRLPCAPRGLGPVAGPWIAMRRLPCGIRCWCAPGLALPGRLAPWVQARSPRLRLQLLGSLVWPRGGEALLAAS